MCYQLEVSADKLVFNLLEWYGLGLKWLRSGNIEDIESKINKGSAELDELTKTHVARFKEFETYVDLNGLRNLLGKGS